MGGPRHFVAGAFPVIWPAKLLHMSFHSQNGAPEPRAHTNQPVPQYASPVGQPQYLPPDNTPQGASFNRLALIALILAAAEPVLSGVIRPQLLRLSVETIGLYSLWAWVPSLVSFVILMTAALCGALALIPGRPRRGRILAFCAIGAAGYGIVAMLFTVLGNFLAFTL